MERKLVEVYTDGSCLGNPGVGGWACVMVYNGIEKVYSGNDPYATNNKMELTAVIQALSHMIEPCNIVITTDSRYVTDAINRKWLMNWVRNKTLNSRPNAELWKQLIRLMEPHKIEFVWVKGHAGHRYNEICDRVAVERAKELKR